MPNYVKMEQTLFCDERMIAGTYDLIVGSLDTLVDMKSSSRIGHSYWLQLAGYKELYMDGVANGSNLPDIDGVAILWLNAKTRTYGKNGAIQGPGWQMVTKDDTTKDWDLFQSVQKLWLAEHEDDKPKEFSYQLSHKK
jgi:hypothetical protein